MVLILMKNKANNYLLFDACNNENEEMVKVLVKYDKF